jgi:glycosyltransferase involved in cell wall biosynthesis
MKKQYITAFPGQRDSYQLPVALSEHGRLAAFATCFYRHKGLLGWLPKQLDQRHADGLEEAKVECMEFTNLASRFGQQLFQPSMVSVWEDNAFSRKALALSKIHRASLLLYEFQADWAFRQSLRHDAAKILFQFHPHPDLEHPLLLADGARYPQFLPSIRRNTRSNLPDYYQKHTRGAWQQADHVIVASHFTAHSLHAAGCPPGKISVVPYGCSFGEIAPGNGSPSRPINKPYFLFVGSGSHRKGLHHLLEAWAQCKLLATHELVVIARVVDPELQHALAATKSVRHIAGVGRQDLVRWFSSAQAFILPSLSEGFGHVFLEALACGCPVIGTRNTMLPDFVEAQPHIHYVEPGNSDSIRAEIERVVGLSADDVFFRTDSVRKSVRNYTWKRFRDGVEAILASFD